MGLFVLLRPEDFFDVFFAFHPRDHKFPAAAEAAQAEIHPRAQDEEPLLPAGMRLFHFERISAPDVHVNGAPPSVAWVMSTQIPKFYLL